MLSGTFGTGQLDINTGRAGNHAAGPEANFSFSVAWFPYDAGWIAGNVGNPDSATGAPAWNAPGEHAAGLVPGLMTWAIPPNGSSFGGLGTLRLPGLDAVTNGMIFTTSSQGNSDVNIVGVAPTNDPTSGSGWIVTVREDSALTGEEVAPGGQHQFEFVYVPYNAQNLIGGYIDGEFGSAVHSAGTFTLTRTSVGTYELTIPGKTGSSGTLLLQVADFEPNTSVPMASRAFLSYQYDSSSGKFIIHSRTMLFDEVADFTDADFYFAWVDFTNPLAPPSGPRLRSSEPVIVTDNTSGINAKEGNIAINTDEPEILITTVDEVNSGTYNDPTTGSPAIQSLIGFFYDPHTLTRTRGPFFIMGNSRGNGQITRHDVKYNPFSRQYNVVGRAMQYDTNSAADLLMVARVSPNSAAGLNEPLLDVRIYDGLTNTLSYDDVAVAVSPKNGNFIVVAEHKVVSEEEGCYGALFDLDGIPLTPTPTRLDLLQSAGDEDDPDVVYLPQKDVFLYLSNTDRGPLANKIVGTVIQTTPAGGNLQLSGMEQSLAITTGPAQGHPASIENPFNGEVITAFDNGNDTSTGQLSYYNIGAGPSFTFTEARPQTPYLDGPSAGIPFRHQHPQLEADPNTGVFLIGYQARNSTIGLPNGYVFSVLDTNGVLMPTQLGAPYYLFDTPAGLIDTGPNYHNIKYDRFTDSFFAVATAGGSPARVVYLASVSVTSSHLPPPPRLTIERSGSNVIIRWPASATGYNLQATASLSAPAWSGAGGVPMADGEFLRVTVPISGNQFFRLEK